MATKSNVITVANEVWLANLHNCRLDCSGYVKQVSAKLGVPLPNVLANGLIDYLTSSSGWLNLGHDAKRASQLSSQPASQGYFVVAGLKDSPNGHVVVLVPGWSPTGHPMGFWGSIGGSKFAFENASLSKAWTPAELPKVSYFAITLP
jgi:hypothetical protein